MASFQALSAFATTDNLNWWNFRKIIYYPRTIRMWLNAIKYFSEMSDVQADTYSLIEVRDYTGLHSYVQR